jgi:phosphatidylglycerophosphate synthase
MNPVVYLLGPSPRSVLGLPLARHLAIAAGRAGLTVVDELPAAGDVIVVDPDVAVTTDALKALAAERSSAEVVADRLGLIARSDVALARGLASVAALVHGREVARLDLGVASCEEAAGRRLAEDLLVRAACKKLLAGDYLGALNRELTIPMVKVAARTAITPNAVTLISFAFTIAAAVPLISGSYRGLVLGAFIQWIGSLLDGVDGKLARLKAQTSVLGGKLDTRLDMVYYAVLFGALAVGLARSVPPALVAALAGATLTGMLASFVVIAGMRRKLAPPDRPHEFGPLVYRLLDTHRTDAAIGFARATIRITTRAGMPHIFLALAVLGLLPYGLAVAALAANLVWILGIRLERLALEDRAGRAGAPAGASAGASDAA